MLLLANSLCLLPLGPCPGAVKISLETVLGFVIEAVIGLVVILVTLLILCKKNCGFCNLCSRKKMELDLVFLGKGERVLGLEQLLRSEAEILGKGTFGFTYKAKLESGEAFAVKRLKGPCAFGREKIEEFAGVLHENLLPLKAYCYSKDETLLVYDYMPRGSLSDFLHWNGGTNKPSLNWQVRRRIAYGVARGVEYLHSQGPTPNACYGNIRSSNILLTNSLDARLSEFGIAQLFPHDSKLKCVAGYRAPEVTNGQEFSQKADVYSFGVLLLELLTGKPPVNALSYNKVEDLPKWARLMFREKPILEVFDQKLLTNQDIEEQMFQILQLAICCTFEYPHYRPSMAVVASRIRDICFSES